MSACLPSGLRSPRRRHYSLITSCLLAGGLVALLSFGGPRALAINPPPTGNAGYDDATANVFRTDELTFITVTMAAADLADLIANPYQDTYKTCTVHVVNSRIDETVANVGIRVRGNTSRSSLKKSWKISFNEFESGRRFHGLKKFNINGEHNDVAITRSLLAWDVYGKMSVPAPRASHVQFKINDGAAVEGVHVNVEQVDDDFVDHWFGSETGNLYKCLYKGARADLRYVSPGTASTYQYLGISDTGQTYQLETNEETPDYTRLAQLIAFINQTSDADFAAGIQTWLNVDNFLRAMAIDVAHGHWDNYWYGANNYYLYDNPTTGQFEYVPYDADNTYGIDFFGIDWANRGYANWGNGGFGSDGDLPPLIRRVLAVPAFEQQYRRYLRQLVGSVSSPANPEQTYTDTVGDVDTAPEPDGPHYDIASVVVSNDATNLYFRLQLAGPLDVGGDTGNGEYLILMNTRSGGNTGNPWGRSINTAVAHDFFVGSWPDGGAGMQLWEYSSSQWRSRSGASLDASQRSNGIMMYSLPLSTLGLTTGSSFAFDVVATGGGDHDSGVDHLSNPNPSTTSFNIPSTPGTYLSYTVQAVTPPVVIDGPFTLGPREAAIDAIRTRLAPYAFLGSYSGGTMDWGFSNGDFLVAFTTPTSYANYHPRDWGVKPYITARTASLRATVPAPPELPPVRINEALPYNCAINTDEAGDYDDWVELYNAGANTVDLGGMYLSDDPGRPRRWQIPAGTTIPGHGFLLIWCDEEPNEGTLHAGFKLGISGESVALFDTDANGNVLVDFLALPALQANVAYGRYPDGGAAAEVLTNVTPGLPNDNTGGPPPPPSAMPHVYINEWMADNDAVIGDPDEPGAYEDYIELYNAEDYAVDLSGMHLTDNLTNPTKFEIPAGVVIAPHGYLLFWADSEPAQGPMHTNFGLSKGGEAIGLYGSRMDCLAPVDSLTFGAQATNVAQGRYADGRPCIKTLRAPSPGVSNVVLSGDTDDDGDVDFVDYTRWMAALAGPELEPNPAVDPCVDADMDRDGDVDVTDFAQLQRAW